MGTIELVQSTTRCRSGVLFDISTAAVLAASNQGWVNRGLGGGTSFAGPGGEPPSLAEQVHKFSHDGCLQPELRTDRRRPASPDAPCRVVIGMHPVAGTTSRLNLSVTDRCICPRSRARAIHVTMASPETMQTPFEWEQTLRRGQFPARVCGTGTMVDMTA